MTVNAAARTPYVADVLFPADLFAQCVVSGGADREHVLAGEKWWREAPDRLAHAVATYLATNGSATPDRNGSVLAKYHAVMVQNDDWDTYGFANGVRHSKALLQAGFNPLVLAALRGTGLRRAFRLRCAVVGMTGTEAHERFESKTLRPADVSLLLALQGGVAAEWLNAA